MVTSNWLVQNQGIGAAPKLATAFLTPFPGGEIVPALQTLSQAFKDIFETGCKEQILLMLACYDVRNLEALRRMMAQGVQILPFPRPVTDAAYRYGNALPGR